MFAHAETQRVYGAATESHNERTRNTLKYSTCSHKWWERLKGSIFGVKPSIPAVRGLRGGLVGGSTCLHLGVDSLPVFPLFLKKVVDIIAPKLSLIFRMLIRLASFPGCWRSSNVTYNPKGAPYHGRENY